MASTAMTTDGVALAPSDRSRLAPSRPGRRSSGLIVALAASDGGGLAFFIAFAGTGAYLVSVRPRNSVGWLLVLIGWGLVLGTVRVTAPPADLLSGDLDPGPSVGGLGQRLRLEYRVHRLLRHLAGLPDRAMADRLGPVGEPDRARSPAHPRRRHPGRADPERHDRSHRRRRRRPEPVPRGTVVAVLGARPRPHRPVHA